LEAKSDRRPVKFRQVTIRSARLIDANDLAALMVDLGYETTTSEMTMRLMSILPNAAYRTFVAIGDNRVCGMIGTFAHPSYEHNDLSGKILALVVSGSLRRSGIGRALIAEAESDLARRGIKRIAVDTKLTRTDAHKFYEALGYERNGWRFVKNLAIEK
jgi:ribosomal protein S18 acetylase RimI-like enzyme